MRTEIPLNLSSEFEKRENCALVGISVETPSTEIYSRLKDGLVALQHRGEQAVGVSFNNGGVEIHKALGYVMPNLTQKTINKFPSSRVAMGHTRYSTVSDKDNLSKELENSQPFLFRIPYGDGVFFEFSIAHNGTVRDVYPDSEEHGPNSDTYRIGQAIVEAQGSFEERVVETLSRLDGAYMLLFVTSDDRLYVASDLQGFKPGVLGIFNEDDFKGVVFASETIALEKMDTRPSLYIERGLFAEITPKGLRGVWRDPRIEIIPEARCTFEKAYFGDAASTMNGEKRTNHAIRKALGRKIAERNFAELVEDGEVVAPVPDSGNTYADGVMEGLGLPLAHPIQKSRYPGRAFMQNTPINERYKDVKKKLNFIPEEIKRKRLIIVDDSIVRGNTMKRIVAELFKREAERITLLSGIPPVTDPCFWGIDFSLPEELIYNQLEMADAQITAYEQELANWLVDYDPKLAPRIKVRFQKFKDYLSIMQNVDPNTDPELSGGCFHCVSGIVPLGVTIP